MDENTDYNYTSISITPIQVRRYNIKYKSVVGVENTGTIQSIYLNNIGQWSEFECLDCATTICPHTSLYKISMMATGVENRSLDAERQRELNTKKSKF